MAFDAGAAVVRFQADLSDLKQGIEDAKKLGKSVGEAVEPAGKAALAIGAIGTAVVGFAAVAINKFSDVGDAVEKMSARTGLSAKSVSALRVAADGAGTSIDTVEASVKKMQMGLDRATDGTFALQGTLKTLGINAKDFFALSPDEQFAKLGNAVASIEDPTARTNAAIAAFGKAGGDLIPLFENGSFSMEEWSQKAQELGVSFDDLSASQAADLNDALGEMQTSMLGVQLAIAQALAPVVTELAPKITELVGQVSSWVAANPELVSTIVKIAAAVAAIMVPLGSFLLILGPIVTAVSTLGTVIAFLASPVGLVILAIGALIAIGVLLYQHWDQVKAAASALGEWLLGVWQSIVDGITGFLQGIFDLYTAYTQMWIDAITFALAFILGLFGTNFGEVAAAAKAFWDGLKVMWQTVSDFMGKLWATFWKGIVDTYAPIIVGITGVLQTFWDGLKGMFDSGAALISGAWTGLWDGIKNAASTAMDAVVGVVKGAINAIIDKINGFIKAANDIAQKGAIGGLKIPMIPEIPKLAAGGIVTRPTLALIGEAGPEAVVPLNGQNSPGVGGITVIIQDPVVRDDSDFDRLAQLFRDVNARDIEKGRLGIAT